MAVQKVMLFHLPPENKAWNQLGCKRQIVIYLGQFNLLMKFICLKNSFCSFSLCYYLEEQESEGGESDDPTFTPDPIGVCVIVAAAEEPDMDVCIIEPVVGVELQLPIRFGGSDLI